MNRLFLTFSLEFIVLHLLLSLSDQLLPFPPHPEGPLLHLNHCLRGDGHCQTCTQRCGWSPPQFLSASFSPTLVMTWVCLLFSGTTPAPETAQFTVSWILYLKTLTDCTNYFKPLFVVCNLTGLRFLEELLWWNHYDL